MYYRPPSSDFATFLNGIEKAIQAIGTPKNILIVGKPGKGMKWLLEMITA